jgi:uncharacterized protein (DUF58 family)
MATPTIRMTSKLPVFVAVVLLLLQIFSPAPPIMFLLLSMVSVLGVGYVWVRQLARGVSIQRKRRYGWAQVGDLIQERWIMHNDAWVPVLWAEIQERTDMAGYDASRAIGLGAQSSITWTTSGSCLQRGVFTLGPLDVVMGDPFGLFTVRLHYAYTDTFVIYPSIVALPTLVEPRGVARGNSRANLRSLELTTNASTVRQYVPGDALNRIHWRTTARRSQPDQESIFVKEYDLEPTGDVWIIADMHAAVHAGQGVESTEEYAVTLAASLANQLLRENLAVGLITHASEPIVVAPRKGQQHLWELLTALSPLHATAAKPLDELLTLIEPAITRNMSIAVITPSSDVAWIEGLGLLLRHGVHVTALLLDAASFGGEGNTAGVLGALADLGVPAHVVDKGARFQSLLQKRQQQPEFKVLGTGRVVVAKEGEAADWVPVGMAGGGS